MAALTLGQAAFFLTGDDSGLQSTLQQSERQTFSMIDRVNQTLQNAASVAIGLFLDRAVQGLTNAIKTSVTDVNAFLETSTLQFETLMGDAARAEEHVRSLFDFAKETPFETGPIIEASRMLQTFGGDALNSEVRLRAIGDAAAATSAPIDELGFWVGRLYSQLQAGQPFGEASMRLQELAVMSPQARLEMEALQASGADANEIFAVFEQDLERFSGAMIKQATTFEGLTSTITDSLSILGAQAFRPFFDLTKEALATIAQLLDSEGVSQGADAIAAAIEDMLVTVITFGRTVVGVGREAFGWGLGLGQQFAAGIQSAVNAVVGALRSLASVVSFWLRPQSPPRILPDIDQWGAEAGQLWLDGFRDASDFTALNDLSSSVRDILQSLVDVGEFEQVDLIPTLFGSRRAIAQAIREIEDLGQVSEDTFQMVGESAGPAGDDAQKLVRAYSDLRQATRRAEQAQQELNDTTQEYTERIAPLDAELQRIRLRQQEIEDQEEIAELRETINDEEASAAERELAALRIQEIEKERQIESIEREQEASEASLEAKVDAAEAEQQAAEGALSREQERINAYIEQNALIQQQTDLLQKMAEEAAAAASAGSGGGGGGSGGGGGGIAVPDIPAPTDIIGQATTQAGQAAEEEISRIAQAWRGEINSSIDDVIGALNARRDAVIENIASFFRPITSVIEEPVRQAISTVQELFSTGGGEVGQTLTQQWAPALDTVIEKFERVGEIAEEAFDTIPAIVDEVSPHLTGLRDVFLDLSGKVSSALTSVNTITNEILGGLAEFIRNNKDEIAEDFGEFAANLEAAWEPISELIDMLIIEPLAQLAEFVSEHNEEIEQIFSAAWTIISGVINGALKIIAGVFNVILGQIKGDNEQFNEGLQQIWEGLKTAVTGIVTGLLDGILALFGTSIEEILENWSTFFGDMRDTATEIGEGIRAAIDEKMLEVQDVFEDILDWIRDTFGDFVADAFELGADIIGGMVDGILSKAQALAQTMIDAINDAIAAGQEALQSRSPSQVARDKLGIPIIEGIIEGLEAAWPELQNAMSILGDRLADEMESISDMLTDTLSTLIGAEADFARTQADAIRELQKIGQDTSRDLADARERQGDLAREEFALRQQIAELQSQGVDEELLRRQSVLRSQLRFVQDEEERLAMEQELADVEAKIQQQQQTRDEELQQAIRDRSRLVTEMEANRQQVEDLLQQERRMVVLQSQVQNELARAEQEAAGMADEDQAARFLQMRTNQILELARLEEDLLEASTAAERRALERQIELERRAQEADRRQFDLEAEAGRSVTEQAQRDLLDRIQDMEEEARDLQDAAAAIDVDSEEDRREKARLEQEAAALMQTIAILYQQLAQIGGGQTGGPDIIPTPPPITGSPDYQAAQGMTVFNIYTQNLDANSLLGYEALANRGRT